MRTAPPRPPPPSAVDPPARRAPESAGLVALPTGDQAQLLFALCRRGDARLPYEEVDGWAWYRWEDADGRGGRVGLRTAAHPEHTEADDLAARALSEAPRRDRSLVELAALVARLLELDGTEGCWRMERVAELLYGPATPSSHRERQLPPLHRWLALLERGRWCLGGAAPANRAQRRSGSSRPPTPGGGGPLLRIERATRVSATVRLDPGLAQSLREAFVEVPPETFRLPQEGHSNRHGNRPSLATRARARVAAALAYSPGGPAIDLECLLTRHAGIDLAPATRRRRLATWLDDLSADLVAIGRRFGVGLASAPARARRVLSTALCLIAPPASHPSAPGVPRRAAPGPPAAPT